VSVADVKEECNFYFPAVIVKDEIVVGVTGDGNLIKGERNIK